MIKVYKQKKPFVCPGCGEKLYSYSYCDTVGLYKPTAYGVYRKEYVRIDTPTGHLYVCEACAIGGVSGDEVRKRELSFGIREK